jgi:hypothetical protein
MHLAKAVWCDNIFLISKVCERLWRGGGIILQCYQYSDYVTLMTGE